MEIVISVGVLAVVIPLVVALAAAGSEAGRAASDDTKAAFIARSVMQEISAARSGHGSLIQDELSWPEFPAAGGRFVIAADSEGNLMSLLGAAAYETGTREDGVAYLVSARGVEHEFEAYPDLAILSRVELSVEFPAVAAREKRSRREFIQLMHPHD